MRTATTAAKDQGRLFGVSPDLLLTGWLAAGRLQVTTTKGSIMNPADVPTVRDILNDYIDADDPYYANLIDALNAREQVLREAVESEVSRLRKILRELQALADTFFPAK